MFQLIAISYVTNGDPLVNDSWRPLDTQKVRGGPSWVYSTSTLWQIDAEAEGEPSQKVMMGPMLQALLEDRFQLKIHRETEEAPIYALTVARTGLKLQPMREGGCIAAFNPSTHPRFFKPGEKLPCGLVQDGGGGTTVTVDAGGTSLDKVADALSRLLDRHVADRTGVTGVFNVHLEFARDETARPLRGNSSPDRQADIPEAPSIFTALEKLGLRLVPEKGPRGFIDQGQSEMPRS
jgi:uncharacterized protein (TIGR03435 family)